MTINGLNDADSALQAAGRQVGSLANNSGQGKDSPVLDVVSKKFNWGAFLLSWIWGLGNRTYITLLIFVGAVLSIVPILGFVAQLGLCIWFGIKGNTWAWQNKKWQSIEHFHEVQKKWAVAGVIVAILGIVISTLISMLLVAVMFSNSGNS